MLATYTSLLKAVVDMINSSIASQGPGVGVSVSQVNLVMPDGKAVTLKWDPEALPQDDGTFKGDWDITFA